MIIKSDFKPAWWLPNAHIQTLYPTLMRRIKSPVDLIERIELADGDFIDLAWAINGLAKDRPLIVFLHGLGGSMDSTYAAGMMSAFNRCGWRSVLMHFRGASKEPNRLARAYHSGDTGDIDYLFKLLAEREPETKKAAVGVSLGGNVLLKWLGEKGPQSFIDAAVAVSVPFQLRLVADRISTGFSRVYQGYLLRRLREVFEQKKTRFSEENMPVALRDAHKWQCFWTFDENVTAPLHGFRHVHHYYRESSSLNYLTEIKTPTLIIHAMDDPFMTPEVVPTEEQLSNDIILELSQKGGHAAFISGKIPAKPIFWLEQRIPDYLKQVFSEA
ncbi:MAG: hydrolase [Tatlockia sp.]|nr:hydrolase [Tatlockia sp.]